MMQFVLLYISEQNTATTKKRTEKLKYYLDDEGKKIDEKKI